MSEINLKGTNYRLTKQRRIILEELKKVCTHPTAESIYKIVRKRIKNISFATVYRNLDFLEKNGYVLKLKIKEKKARYDGESKPHRHLICKCCGKIIDIFDCRGIIIRSKELKACGFVPDCGCLEIPGFCKQCEAKVKHLTINRFAPAKHKIIL
jgi:Fur family ferric uptake transcriptional regulator